MLVEFFSVIDAVRYAVEIQRAIIDRNATKPEDERIIFHVGVNLGDVIADRDNDIYGDGVNIAARLEALAEPGGVCISRPVRDQIRDKLLYAFEDIGEQEVKNIARPLRVYALSAAATAALPPVIAPAPPRATRRRATRRRELPRLFNRVISTPKGCRQILANRDYSTGSHPVVFSLAMPPPLLLLQDVIVTFGVTPLLSGAELAVAAGDRVCLVGRNGSGKSTLLRVAAGLVQPDAGDRFAQPGSTIYYLPQEPDLSGFASTLAYVEAGFGAEMTGSHHRALYLLKELGLSGEEDPTALSGGEARRAALARVLAPSPDILLLDEPTNHLDLPGIEWLERELAGMRSGIVLISHDRRLLERISRTTVWLDRGITRLLKEGFKAFEPWRDAMLEQEAGEQHKLGRKIAMEEDWLRYGVTARRTRNQRRLAELHALRRKRKQQRSAQGSVRLEAAQAELSGRLVAVARAFPNPMAVARSCGIFRRASCAATGSGSSAPTVPARRHCSIC